MAKRAAAGIPVLVDLASRRMRHTVFIADTSIALAAPKLTIGMDSLGETKLSKDLKHPAGLEDKPCSSMH